MQGTAEKTSRMGAHANNAKQKARMNTRGLAANLEGFEKLDCGQFFFCFVVTVVHASGATEVVHKSSVG